MFRRASTLENVDASSSYILEGRLTPRVWLERVIWLTYGHPSPQYTRYFYIRTTCVLVVIKNYAAYQRYLHITEHSNGGEDRLTLQGYGARLFI